MKDVNSQFSVTTVWEIFVFKIFLHWDTFHRKDTGEPQDQNYDNPFQNVAPIHKI